MATDRIKELVKQYLFGPYTDAGEAMLRAALADKTLIDGELRVRLTKADWRNADHIMKWNGLHRQLAAVGVTNVTINHPPSAKYEYGIIESKYVNERAEKAEAELAAARQDSERLREALKVLMAYYSRPVGDCTCGICAAWASADAALESREKAK